MFSHKIKKKCEIKNDFYAIPFGHRCTSAIACKIANIRKMSLPFDWVIPLFPSKIKEILSNNFDEFIPDVPRNYFNKYSVGFAHFNTDISTGIEEYKRRISRFNKIISEKKQFYFVYINEDYLYNEEYRSGTLNKIFNEILDLEKFLKLKYQGIDFNILYFDFKDHIVPTGSNIINVVLHTDKLYNDEKDCFGPILISFRDYCGKILASLFNTTTSSFEYKDSEFY